jgi:poly(A) polymerase
VDVKRQFAVEVVERLKGAGYQALWAGGCVRDFLMGREPKDFDVATDARPDDVRQLFGARRTLAVGAAFGVIIVRGPSRAAGDVEVATFRTDVEYLDGRRPSQVVFSSPEEDAQRRDFTINGMFYDPVGQRVLDYVGGEQDLAAGVIRAIGEPHDRMREDKLRMLRAVRFAATLDFALDETTAAAIREMAAEIHVVSAERIAQELKKMLVDGHRRRAMELAHAVGLLERIVPELRPVLDSATPAALLWERTLQMMQMLQQPGFELAMAALLHTLGPESAEAPASKTDAVDGICRRMRLSNDESERIGWLVAHQHVFDGVRGFSPARLKRLLSHRFVGELIELLRVRTLAAGGDLSDYAFCTEYLERTPPEEINPLPLLTGDDLIRSGLKPGPGFRELLERVRDAQLNGEIRSQAEAIGYVARLCSGEGTASE